MLKVKIIALTTIAFIAVSFIVACNKSKIIHEKSSVSSTEPELQGKPKVDAIFFTWDEWGHHEDIKDLEGNVVTSHCPGGGLCNFRVKKIKIKNSKIAQLEENENGDYIDVVIDEDYPMTEINNFRITNNITEVDEDGKSYTIFSGVYPYNETINGYRLPVVVN